MGHQAGDTLLIETAVVLKKNCRGGDIVCRLGGDEFLIFLPCDDPGTFLQTKLEKIRENLDRDIITSDKSVHVSCSMGVALVPRDGMNLDELYKHADKALYKAKENGKNGYVFCQDL